ncbi:MAG TPA: phasin family protein [Syntrophales bacterium]|jgi:polyhydroxyalkanoate synthesis regulator phasin|nr:phasin family protein [Syntrophales bacterium]HPC33745.1 phasin family protein [Syntrophales bacterium]
MLDSAKKAVLVGTGMALAATDRIQEVVDGLAAKKAKAGTETREAINAIARKTRKTREAVEGEAEKLITDFTAFWYYTNLTDEMEDRVEKMVSLIMKRLEIPERRELEEIKARIEKLEKDVF